MANTPKAVRKDAKALAKKRRESDGAPVTFGPKSNIRSFTPKGAKQDEYLTNYSVKHSDKSGRSKEFIAGRAARLEGRLQWLSDMDATYRASKQ